MNIFSRFDNLSENYMRKFVVSLLIVIVHRYACLAQDIGEPAPDILFSKVLNKTGVTPASLKNKYIVLDFWATWCGPCVASFPHFSKLSEEFSSDSVVFAIISSEEENKVRKFLSNRTVYALHLIDSITETSKKKPNVNDLSGLTAQGFKVEGIPHAVVIDKSGILRWVGTSQLLTADIIKDILTGKFEKIQEEEARRKVEQEQKWELRRQELEKLKKDTIDGGNYKLIIAKTPFADGGMRARRDMKKGKIIVQFSGKTMDFLYFYFTRSSSQRVKNLLSAKEGGYFVHFEMDTSVSVQEFRETALTALAKWCHVSFDKKEISAEVWNLKIVDQKKFLENSKPRDPAGRGSSDINDHELVFNNAKLSGIIADLEDELKVFIELEKNDLNDKLADFTIPMGDIDFMSQKLFDLYGIKMVKSTKKTAITEIRESL
jgi:thiol-disulfide isomerase/thioredoxin